ncbi:MAG: YopX family protein [Bacteroides cellulosilyticus]|nr:YopX family protein [Bacteroides cellulosilyticus]
MREVKFRGKSLEDGRWLYGDLYHTGDLTCICDWTIRPHTVENFAVDPATVGQYTGLKDKNGREIYEGDILLLSDKKSHSEDVVVEHGLYGWTFYNPQTATFYPDGSHTYAAVENCRFMFGTGIIVGNIHDNPELLKGGER